MIWYINKWHFICLKYYKIFTNKIIANIYIFLIKITQFYHSSLNIHEFFAIFIYKT
jgi:hypothetical protein